MAVLTVLCVDTSSSDFIKDHVLWTSWKATFYTVKYKTTSILASSTHYADFIIAF